MFRRRHFLLSGKSGNKSARRRCNIRTKQTILFKFGLLRPDNSQTSALF
jgi:hypothetical protein